MAYRSTQGGSVLAYARVTLTDTGVTKTFPVMSMRLHYAVNRVPEATVEIPYGMNTNDWYIAPLSLPSNKYSHRIKLYYKYASAATDLIFDGYITSISHSRGEGRGKVGLSTVFKCHGWIGLLSAQLTSVLRNEAPMIWTGNPWYTNATGLSLVSVLEDIADGDYTVSDAIILALRSACTYQDDYDIGFESGETGATLAYSALAENVYTSNNACAIHTSYDWETRRQIARAVVESLTEAGGHVAGSDEIVGGSLWTALLAFCERFSFAIIPMFGDYSLVPMCYPGWTSVGRGNHPRLNMSDIAQYTLPTTGMDVTPLHGVVMVDEYASGCWGQIAEKEIIASYDTSSIYSETDARYGRVIRYPKPGWLYPVESGLTVGARICHQIALNEAFGGTRMYLRLPYISGIAPGTLVELNSSTGWPSLGGRTALGVAAGIEYKIVADPPEVWTDLLLTHIMERKLYNSAAMYEHPIARGYFLYSTMAGYIGY